MSTENQNETQAEVAAWVAKSDHVRRETIVVFRGLKSGHDTVTDKPLLHDAIKALVEIHAYCVEGPSNRFTVGGNAPSVSGLNYVNDPVAFHWHEKYGRAVEKALITLAEAYAKNNTVAELLFIEPDATFKAPVRAWLLMNGHIVDMETDDANRNVPEAIERQQYLESLKGTDTKPEAPDPINVTAKFTGNWDRSEKAYNLAQEYLNSIDVKNPYGDAMGVDVVSQPSATS